MRVIDVDSHFYEPFTWLTATDSKLQDELLESMPPVGFVDMLFGEVLANVPMEQRRLLGSILQWDFLGDSENPLSPAEAQARLADSPLGEFVFGTAGGSDGADRIVACDGQRIDLQFLHPTWVLAELQRVHRHRPDLLARFCSSYNSWAIEALDGYSDRLSPVALVDFSDPATAVEELARVRERGVRFYLLQLYPVADRALSHPDHEDIWAATGDLGLVPTLHVGTGSVMFDASWLNTGRPDVSEFAFRLAAALVPQIPQTPLADLLFNGVFERHPEVVVLCSEFGVSWLQSWWERIALTTHKVVMQGLLPWRFPLTAHEYIQRNVRFSPLPGDPIDRFIADFGIEMIWFGSDYPHPEGSSDAVREFEQQLDGKVDAEAKERFFGKNVGEVLARTA